MIYPPEDQIAPKYRRQMKTLAQTVNTYFNGTMKGHGDEVGFCLVVVPPKGDGAAACYTTNLKGADLARELEALRQRVSIEGLHT
jgi:DNA-binding transcriptional MocR family regulator